MPTAAERKALTKGLLKLNENMLTLAELSELSIRKAVEALAHPDHALAEDVFTLDQEIYALQIEVERTCGDLIALHAPVASDLRTVTTSLKMTTDLDRIGRYAKDIAEISLQLPAGAETWYGKLPGLAKMVDHTIEMVDTATDAFVRREAERVRNIAEADDAVDALYEATFHAIVQFMKDGTLEEETGARYLLVTRYLERIADHAVNLGERIVYMVTGERVPRVRFADRAAGRDTASRREAKRP
jgi:phosphate transport system protein